MRLAAILLAAVVALVLGAELAQAEGRACCPRVTSEHNADTTDLMRFRNYAPWKDKQGNDLAIAAWQYLCDYETGLYHFGEVIDGPDPFMEYAHNREPLKMLNVYNMGYCGIFGPTVEGIYYGCGFETGRSFGLAAWAHCATEIFYDGAWHYFDVDVRGALLKPDGVIASLEEARKDKQLWLESRTKIKPFFPHHSTAEQAAKVADIYAKSGLDYQYRWFQGSHTADYSLRPGETLTRWWQPQGGRWNHQPSYNKDKFLHDTLIPQAPRGMKPNHREFTKWNHGNGLFHYAPNLKAPSTDFAEGVWSAEGLEPGGGGLTLTAEKGLAVFQVFSPFVIVGKIADLDNLDTAAEASVIFLDAAAPVTVEISRDNGLSWQEAGRIEAKGSLDLTKFVRGTYGYLAKFSLAGKKGDLAIRSLAIDTWTQVAPISLPRLKKGTNHLTYAAGDRYNGVTMPVLVLPNVADPDDLKKYVTEMPKDYDPRRNLARIKGNCIVKMTPPPGAKIAWASVGATMNTHQEKGALNTANRIGYAVGNPESVAGVPPAGLEFKDVYNAQGKLPTWINHWRYNYDTDIKLDQPADVLYVRYFGNPGVNVIRACLHCTPSRPADPAVRITHGYEVNKKLIEKTVDMAKPGDYTVDCDGDGENVFIRIEKASR